MEGDDITSAEVVTSTTAVPSTKVVGKFYDALSRNGRAIKEERATIMGRMAERVFRAKVQDLYDQMTDLELQRDARLDLSPDNKDAYMRPADFNAELFVSSDLAIGEQIRDLKIRFALANDRYFALFGKRVGSTEL